MRLRTYFSLSFAFLIIVVIVSMSVVISQRTSREVREEIGGSLAALAYQMSDKLDYYMWSRYNEVLLLSHLKALRFPSDLEEVSGLLHELNHNIPSFSWVGLSDPDGNILSSTGGILVGSSIAERPVYKKALEKPFIGDVHDAVLLSELLPNPTGEPLKFVDISTPLFDDNGKLTGVLAAHLSWEWSKEIKSSVLKSLQGDSKKEIDVFILSAIDDTVLLGPESWPGKKLSLEDFDEYNGANEWAVLQWPDGREYLTGFAQGSGYNNYPGLGWKIVVRQPADVAFAPIHALIWDVVVLGIVLIALFTVLAWVFAGKISKPLSRIAEAADRLRWGEKTEIPHARGIKDIEVLSSSLRGLIAELTATESELVKMEDQAHRDKLTGLLNRSSLEAIVGGAIRQAEERLGALAFLYLDLDGFKGVNDSLGHDAGDELLRQAAARIKDSITVQGHVFRMGGDEFVVVLALPLQGALLEASEVATGILESLREPFELEAGMAKVSCSIGGAMWPHNGTDPLQLLKLADQALYASKSKGKNKLTFAITEHAS
ncbi:diguanylate cyclase [Paenibacillus pinisoli]|uniref:Diguanylate cyclase n=1 Tax=Paenibacillus pinisoli TaxID=1276110 RepID=A0A3A6PPI0_9BACL|nr:sensor domain-containing diguanylate cyclase [Paenibacillus pinisoli]RJX40129.1 diguanylate cyclase [Paenibacillus pinisoli]